MVYTVLPGRYLKKDVSLDCVSKKRQKYIQGVPEGKDNILGGQSIGHSKQNCLYEHVSYAERFPR